MKHFMTLTLSSVLRLAPLALLSSVPALAVETVKAPEVTLDEVKTLVSSKGATFLDANSKDMYKKAHIPGAVNFAENEAKLATVLPSDKNALIVAYCGGPRCTAWEEAAAKVKELGYTNIKHFKGGITVWQESTQKDAKKKS